MSVKTLFDLTGKAALVTGGSRGLGLQMAEALGEMGAKVALTARKPAELDEAAKHLRGMGIQAVTVTADLSRHDTIPAVVEQVIQALGQPIDVLVNNAGTTWGAPAEDHPYEAWRKVMGLNIDAMFLVSQVVARRCMIPRRTGKIVNVASVAGLAGNPPGMATIAYNTSKGAAVNFTRALAAEWGRHNINVNAICPGFFPSKMANGILAQIGDQVIAATPLHRLGGEEDLKGAVVFLASEASRHVTGQFLAVDGGAWIA
jgi:NAD(P)-dependent dehydrogenase (short-subunit alcohol dehydrogenase family)